MDILCIGDSLTYGYGVGRPHTWCAIASQLTGWNFINLGANGATTGEMLDAMPAALARIAAKTAESGTAALQPGGKPQDSATAAPAVAPAQKGTPIPSSGDVESGTSRPWAAAHTAASALPAYAGAPADTPASTMGKAPCAALSNIPPATSPNSPAPNAARGGLFVMGGLNDLFMGMPIATPLRHIRAICEQARRAGLRPAVGLPMQISEHVSDGWCEGPVDMALVRAAYAEFAEALLAQCAEDGVPVLDFRPLLGPEDLGFDGVHLNRLGHQHMAEAVAAFWKR